MGDTLWPIHNGKHESRYVRLFKQSFIWIIIVQFWLHSFWFPSLLIFSLSEPFSFFLFSLAVFVSLSLCRDLFFRPSKPHIIHFVLQQFTTIFSHSPWNPHRFFVSHFIFSYTFLSIAINNNSTMIFSPGFPFSYFYFSHSIFAISPQFSPFLFLLPLLLSRSSLIITLLVPLSSSSSHSFSWSTEFDLSFNSLFAVDEKSDVAAESSSSSMVMVVGVLVGVLGTVAIALVVAVVIISRRRKYATVDKGDPLVVTDEI